MPETASTSPIPARSVRSASTPPWTGTDAPHTPLRPPATVSGTWASAQMRTTSATWPVVAGRATTAALAGTSPASAQCRARGHQSRLASATAASSSTTAQTPRRASITSAGTSTAPDQRAAEPRSSIGGVGTQCVMPGVGAGKVLASDSSVATRAR